ncbi:MAG: ice-binding family protein [Cyclobacteriaceae bacterium]|nr:ice-binding family protein [Cyclobacteriaceae bacterium]
MKLRQFFPITATLLIVLMSGCNKKDDPGIRPWVIDTSPVNEATGIATNAFITASFSEEMDPASITTTQFTLQKDGVDVVGETSYDSNTATFTPSADMAPNSLFTATLTNEVKNKAGTGLIKNYVWSFTTGETADVVTPTVSLTDPVNNATNVSLNHKITATFSEPMEASTITSLTYTLKQGTTLVSGNIKYEGNAATFTPVSDLLPNKVYTSTITTGAKDKSGNALAANYVITFTTGGAKDMILPMVQSLDPLNNAMGNARNKVVSAGFSEAMDPSTINASTFSLKQGGTSVDGTIAYSGTTATFTPTTLLAASTMYTAAITTGAKDVAGNAVAASTVWSFTTGTATSGLSPVNLGAAGNYVLLAKTSISNVPTSAITGDIGLSPAAESFITGFTLTANTGYSTATEVTGKVYAADQASPTPINLTTAVNDMITAYNDAAGRPSPDFSELATGNIGGKILTSGLYKWTTTVTVPSDVTISGGPNDVWIFQIDGDLTMGNAVSITLNGGAQAKNIFWQVAGTVTIGTNSHFEGVILSMTGITLQTSASMTGRALAQTAIILDANAVTKPN